MAVNWYNNMVNWIIGPQLIGVIILIVGYLSARFLPKTINYLYGYRTASSMKNQQTWDEANWYAPKYMLKIGVWIFVTGIIITFLLSTLPVPIKIKTVLTLFLFMASGMLSAILLITATEKHLDKTFNKDKNEIR